MRLWILPLAALAGFTLGCNKSPEGGSAGTHNSFTITAPTMSTTIKQDNKESVKLSLSRGSEFKRDVKLSVAAIDKMKLELNKDTVKASEASPAEFTVTITPDKDAPASDYKVKVTGTPDGSGSPTTVEFTVKVAENK